jgi:ADP-ribose pyrophosphatase
VLTEVIHVFMARGLTPCDATPEQHEVFETRWIPMAEATALAADGRLQDAKTITGLIWAQTRLQAEKRAGQAAGSRT